MKQILISIKPEWVAKILNGDKTIEIRKTMPKTELPCKVYIYCTKEKSYMDRLVQNHNGFYFTVRELVENDADDYGLYYDVAGRNGEVIAEFNLNKVEKIKFDTPMNFNSFNGGFGFTDTRYNFNLNKSCLTENELFEYLGEPTQIKGEYHLTYELNGYAWHIEDLVIYDTLKELSEFGLTKAPQSYQYIKEEV